MHLVRAWLLLPLIAALALCGGNVSPAAAGVPEGEVLRVRVLERHPHDATAFTQGLEFDGGRLYESRGLYGESALTEIDPETGAVLRRADLAEEFFAEGLTVLDDRIVQLTWREHTAFVYDPATFAVTGQHAYTTEGWGLCDLDGELVMSDGTATLTFRDPGTFAPTRTVEVRRGGEPVQRLNELECAGGRVWANVWHDRGDRGHRPRRRARGLDHRRQRAAHGRGGRAGRRCSTASPTTR